MANQSAYQAAVHAGYKGTYEEWEAELSKGYTLNQVLERELQLGKLTMKREYMFPPKELTDALSKGDVRGVSIRNTPVRIRGEQLGPSQINNTKHYLPASEMKPEDLWAVLERPGEPNANGVVYPTVVMNKALKDFVEKNPDMVNGKSVILDNAKLQLRGTNPDFDYDELFKITKSETQVRGMNMDFEPLDYLPRVDIKTPMPELDLTLLYQRARHIFETIPYQPTAFMHCLKARRQIIKPGYTYRAVGIEPYWDGDSRSYKLATKFEKCIRKPERPTDRGDDYNWDLYAYNSHAYNHAVMASLYNALELTRHALYNRSVAASKFIIDAFADNNKTVQRPYFTSVDNDSHSIVVKDWFRMMDDLYPELYSQRIKYPVPKDIVESIDTNDYRADSKLAEVFGATKKVPTYIFHPLFGRTINTELK